MSIVWLQQISGMLIVLLILLDGLPYRALCQDGERPSKSAARKGDLACVSSGSPELLFLTLFVLGILELFVVVLAMSSPPISQ
jgi:hypothetical protein